MIWTHVPIYRTKCNVSPTKFLHEQGIRGLEDRISRVDTAPKNICVNQMAA